MCRWLGHLMTVLDMSYEHDGCSEALRELRLGITEDRSGHSIAHIPPNRSYEGFSALHPPPDLPAPISKTATPGTYTLHDRMWRDVA